MELLAPAGDMQSLKAAVCAGADAVYIGLDKLNARIKAPNFNTAELAEITEYCHLRKVKLYVVINTLIKEREFYEVITMLKACDNANVDALIVQDLAVTDLARRYAPNCQLHASTQLGVHNLESAIVAQKLGFSRVVLSRETTREDIESIKKHTDLEIEYFVHGALCAAFSGNCYFSSTITGCSGNRGQCLQFCRKKYTNSINGRSAYWLSAKDQCLISVIDSLKELGVDSLKIEGRLRSAAYVYSSVNAYRKVIDGKQLNDEDIYRMQTTFNRGNYTTGYAFDGDIGDIIYPDIQNNIGFKIGAIKSCAKKGDKYLLTLNNKIPLNNSMSCKIIDNGCETGGFSINAVDRNQILCDKPYKGDVHITSDDLILKEIKESKIPCGFKFRAVTGEPMKLSARADGVEITAESEYVTQKADSLGGAQSAIENLSRLGGTDFTAVNIVIDADDDAYIPLSAVNKLRRTAIAELTDALIGEYNAKKLPNIKLNVEKFKFKKVPLNDIIIIIDADKFSKLDKSWLNRAEVVTNLADYSKIRQNAANTKTIYIKLPIYAPIESMRVIKEFFESVKTENIGIYAQNIYALEIAYKYGLPIIIGDSLNVTNSLAYKILGVSPLCVSTELKREEVFKSDYYIYAFGHLPLMTLSHCPIKVITGCDCRECEYRPFDYTDSRGKFYVKRERVGRCLFTLYNGVPHNLTDVKGAGKVLDFTVGDIDLNAVIKCATDDKKVPIKDSTRGSFKRGVN